MVHNRGSICEFCGARHDPEEHADMCEQGMLARGDILPQGGYRARAPETVTRPAKQQVRIIMEGGSFMDLEPPPDFQFAALVQSIRAMDHFMNGKVYIPGDKILAIILWDATNPPVMVNAPSTETKQ